MGVLIDIQPWDHLEVVPFHAVTNDVKVNINDKSIQV